MSTAAARVGSDDALLRALRELRAGIDVDAAYGVVDRILRPRLLASFQAHGMSRDEAEEVVQITLVRVYQGVAGLREESCFLPWLFVIARHERQRWQERRGRQPAATGDAAAERLPDRRPDAAPEAARAAAERLRAVRAAVASLPPQQRQCLLLRAVHELSYEEIAATLRLSVHTVRNHLAQARRGLRVQLGEDFGREDET